MGRVPIPPLPRVTNLDQAKRLFIKGNLDVDQFEYVVGELLEFGLADEVYTPGPNNAIEKWLRAIALDFTPRERAM